MRPDLLYWRWSSAGLALLAPAGFLLVARHQASLAGGLLVFDTTQNVLHAALAALALAFATGLPPAGVSRRVAGWTGVAYLALAALGFFSERLFGLGPLVGMRLEVSENALHLALGAWGAKVGFGEEK
jgi:hypothetical protein